MTTIIVSSGVTSTHLTLHNGDILEVLAGGSAVSITVNGGATEYVYSGGTALSTTLNNGGGLQLSSGATASVTTINEDSTLFVFSGGNALSTTVSNNGGLQIYADGTASVTTVHSGGTEFVLGGTAVSTTLDTNTFEVVTSGGSAISTTVSSGGIEDVYSDGTASFATVDNGGTENVSGTAVSTTVNNGGFEYVSVGGTARFTTLNSGGAQGVSSSGMASFTTVNSGGIEYVFSAATARFTAVKNGGSAFVFPSGTTSSATVSSGGVEYVYASGTTISTTVKSGGSLIVYPGGTATGTVVSSGGNLVEPVHSGSGGLKIDLSYDASVADAPAGFKMTVSAAVANLEALISTPITITIDVGYGEVSGTLLDGNLGESESTGISVSYQTLRSALLARTATSDEIAAAASLPTNDPTSGGTFYVAYAEAEALDLSPGPGAGTAVGAIGLSSTLPFTYGTTNAVTPDTYDAFGVVEHEITEVMGRTDELDSQGDGNYTPLDLFRYSSPGDRDLTPTSGHFSVNGTDLLSLFNDPSNGGDAGDWATSVPNDSFDAFSSIGAMNPVTPTDLKVMDVIGFTPTVSCFAAGTRIATARGEIAVQSIGVGELVPVLLGGGFSQVIWVGRREVDCARHPNPRTVWPVRVAAGAFGPRRPHTDLYLSPDHAIHVEAVLIPIKHLINGSTIVQVPVARVTYHHMELAQHDVVLAEGLPAESFLDLRDGSNYTNRPGPIRLYPDYSARMWEAFGCARLVVTGPEFLSARALVALHAARQEATPPHPTPVIARSAATRQSPPKERADTRSGSHRLALHHDCHAFTTTRDAFTATATKNTRIAWHDCNPPTIDASRLLS
jgi:autotransporter passenger strand-loop-strand repeat protein